MMKLKGKSINEYSTDCKCFKDFPNSTATRLTISIFDEDDNEPHISEPLVDWSREDYLRAVKIADKIKEMLLDVNMDIIQYPTDFMCNNGETFANILKLPSKDEGSYVDVTDANRIITSNIKLNRETRVFKHIDTLKEIIGKEKIELLPENIGVVELGKQTFSEQKDVTAKQKEIERRNRMMKDEKTNTLEIWN